ncbi:hypothetical protein ACLMJV_17020 [Sinorhizobium meliloti]|uniref:hypothetical protein n=1 Tax=Rhizobium meliloti TaxID=382 RepID=UPI00398D3CC7
MTRDEQFDIFWKSFPNKKGKADARKAFDKAIKQTTLEAMLKAITAYVANKPDWQGYKHPATWLRAGCWDDEWEPAQARVQRPAFAQSANYGRPEPVAVPEPETPEQRARKAEMARRLRETAAAMRTVQ